LSLYTATFQGHKNRYKLRLRYYDDQPHTPVFFEIKRRVNEIIIKEKAGVRKQSVRELIEGRCPRPSDLLDPEDVGEMGILRRFCEMRAAINARPRMNVYFEREAWVAPGDDQMRVTFDRDITGARLDGAMRPNAGRWYRAFIPYVVLELKFEGRFPIWMRELVRNWDLDRTTMAKYCTCTEQMPQLSQGVFHERLVTDLVDPGFANVAGRADGRNGAGADRPADRLLPGSRSLVDVHLDALGPLLFTDVRDQPDGPPGDRRADDDATGGECADRGRAAVSVRDDPLP
jgi:hypothetical protein